MTNLKTWFEKHGRFIIENCERGRKDPDPGLQLKVGRIGDSYGYGAAMHALGYAWEESLKQEGYPPGASFTIGPCVSTVELALEKLKAVGALNG